MEKRGLASIAILPSGSVSGHFVDTVSSQCFGLFGTQIACERECSRGEDYRLINLSILDFNSKKEVQVIVESHGQDAARFQNATNIHGWEEHVIDTVQRKSQGIQAPSVRFECEILKADEDAERHIQKYLPSLAGRGAIVNVGTMHIKGLKFDSTQSGEEHMEHQQTRSNADHEIEGDQGTEEGDNELNIHHISGLHVAYQIATSISVSGKGPCSDIISSCKEFAEVLREELEVEGLSDHRGGK